jgi:thymidylate kinase
MKKLSQNDQLMIEMITQQCVSNDSMSQTQSCYCIYNNDGSVRWVWPTNSKSPQFLRFYHTGQWKAKVFSWLMKAVFYLRLQHLIFRSTISIKVPSNWQNWALFTGTVGPKRKAIFWTRQAMENHYVKVPLGERALSSLQNEAIALSRLSKSKVFHIQTPLLISDDRDVFKQTDARTTVLTRVESIFDIPALPLMEMLSINSDQRVLGQIPFWNESKLKIKSMDWVIDERLPRGIRTKLKDLLNTVDESKTCLTSSAHGDFTPWNMYLRNDQLVLIDWENYHSSAPILFDVFHFIYQNEILNGGRSYANVRKTIANFFNTPVWSNWIERNNIDLAHYEKLYLLMNTATYLELFAHQEKWHMQVEWLIEMWSEAISHHLVMESPKDVRKVILSDIFDHLRHAPYAVMKLTEGHPHFADVLSDIDICIEKKHANELISWLKLHGCVTGIRATHQSFMKQIRVELINGSYVHLDLIHAFKRKHIQFMNAEDVLATAVTNVFGIKVPRGDYEMAYIALFYTLNHAPIPDKYVENLDARYYKNKEEINQKLNELFGGYNGDYRKMLSEVRGKNKLVLQHIWSLPANLGLSGWLNKINYGIDKLREMRASKGYVITFSGVDGAGKSTVISLVRDRIEKEFRQKVVVLRHRPSVLPILSAWRYGKEAAEAKSVARLPRQGENKSSIGSLIRFAYYYMDYLFGQFYIHVRYVSRGYVVLYDRYYFDFVNDSKRSNIHISPKITAALYRFLVKPKYNFLLYAQPDEILKRKQELDRETIEDLTSSYLKHFATLSAEHKSSKYIPLRNDELSTTVNSICQRLSA